MRRWNLIKAIGGLGSSAVMSTHAVVNARAESGLPTDFDPSNKEEVSRFLNELFTQIEELRQFREEVQQGKGKMGELENEIQSLSVPQKEAVKAICRTSQKWNFGIETQHPVDEESDLSTNSNWQRASYKTTVSAEITIPVCCCGGVVYTGKDFDDFDYTQKLEWFYDGSEVKNVTQTVEADSKYYGVVG